MSIMFNPIGFVENTSDSVPRHWTVSDIEGFLTIKSEYREGLADLQVGQRIVVLFHFHQSPPFDRTHIKQAKRGTGEIKGVFSICSPIRPNGIGLSVLQILSIEESRIRVKGLDMLDGTPILDIKPHMD